MLYPRSGLLAVLNCTRPSQSQPRLLSNDLRTLLPANPRKALLTRSWLGRALCSALSRLDVDLLRDLDRIIDLDAEIAHGALDLRMSEQKLDGTKVSRSYCLQRLVGQLKPNRTARLLLPYGGAIPSVTARRHDSGK